MKASFPGLYILILLFNTLECFSQNSVSLLDLRARSADITNGNLYSALHILNTIGIPYDTTSDLNVAFNSKIIFCSSNIEPFTFDASERLALQNFISNGGVLISCNIKDPALYHLFGVNGYSYLENRFMYHWDTTSSDSEFKWMNTSTEVNIRLGDSTLYPIIFGTRGYTLNGATQMAHFEDGSASATRFQYGSGTTYMIGMAYKDIVHRNHIARDYKANYVYSNSFEPGMDVFILYFKEVIKKHLPFCVLKHSATENSQANFIITHDVDAMTSMNLMTDYAEYELKNNLKASYMVTTHYIDDALAGDYYTNRIEQIKAVRDRGHNIESHSVGHFPDFDDMNIVPEGSPVNPQDYYPYFSYQTYYATVYGEAYVSKALLENDIGVPVSIFRPGYLAFPYKLINVLTNTGYKYSSSRSANDVLTTFPYYGTEDQKMDGAITNILEMPNLISDVFMSDPITENNYSQKIDQWVHVSNEQLKNNAPVIYMLHPTRAYKLTAMHDLLKKLPEGFATKTLLELGEFWKKREALTYTSSVTDSVLTIVIDNTSLPLDEQLSLIVDKGQGLKDIEVKDESGNELTFLQSLWQDSSVIVHFKEYQPIVIQHLPVITYVDQFGFELYPSPASDYVYLDLDLDATYLCSGKLYNTLGQPIMELLPEEELPMSPYSFKIDVSSLSNGIYIAILSIGDHKIQAKIQVN